MTLGSCLDEGPTLWARAHAEASGMANASRCRLMALRRENREVRYQLTAGDVGWVTDMEVVPFPT